jgi:pyruvate formate lyase activating enzyme
MKEIIEGINPNFVKKSRFQKKISSDITQCATCERQCKIPVGAAGHCQTRINYNGEILTIVNGCIPAKSINPIEKKPLYHFFPGSTALTVGTFGCNFDCFWCQNHHISHPMLPFIDNIRKQGNYYSPEMLIKEAIENNCHGTSISFNEPTLLFEYSLDVFKLAKKAGLYNTYVSNGYMTEKVLRALVKHGLDAINIDIKGDPDMVKKHCGADAEKVWRNAKLAKELGVHVEITTLLIESINSNDEIIQDITNRIATELGELTPFHISRFYPQYKSNEYGITKPTSLKSLYNAYKLSRNSGLSHVYIGNISNKKYSHTTCPNCLKIVIKRSTFSVEEICLDKKGNCNYCGYHICEM